MRPDKPNLPPSAGAPDLKAAAEALALQALAAGIANQRLAERFLSISGMTAPDLRRSAGEPALLAAFLRFLEAHEPDLVAIAEDLGVEPEQLVGARRTIEA